MSLIDDALKRAQAAGEAAPGRPSGPRPWSPAPLPDAGLARRRAALRWSGIGAAVVLAAVAAVWLYRRESSSALPLPVAGGSGEEPAPAVAVAPTAAPTAPAAPTPLPARPRPIRIPPPVAEAPGESAAGAEVEPTSVPQHAAQAITNGRTYAGSVTPPGGGRIELGGIVWSEQEPRALLNDRIVAVGAYVEGFTVARIEEGRVVLEKDGLTIFLTVK